MERLQSLLLEVWREACQHIEIHKSVAPIAALIEREVPLDYLRIQRIEPEHRLIATVAQAPRAATPDARAQHEPTDAELKKLLAWIKQGEVTRCAGADRTPPAFTALRLPSANLLAAPLSGSGSSLGVVALVAPEGQPLTDAHAAVLRALQQPLAVALENDRRLHEMAALREAAEADRRSLLRRLGRKDLGETIVGEDSGLRQVMQRVAMVSHSDAPVLILGETGTGKEVIARAIHNKSGRHAAPFIRVNCGAIPPELIDSQLFGHERGSFTGAAESRKGWFERADGGTLFLDEIGELPHDAQVRFLRVLQDGYVERVGGQEPLRVDVRVVAATHRDLAAMVQANRFREDLWYRIAVFPVLLPPLRDRPEDIPALARHFAQRAAERFGLSAVEPNGEDIALLQTYPWPGNIRELGSVIDRAVILGEGGPLQIAVALGLSDTKLSPPASPPPSQPTANPTTRGPIVTLDEATRRHIIAALRATQGRIEGNHGAAQLLDINPHTLRARMRKLGIDWTTFREPQFGEL